MTQAFRIASTKDGMVIKLKSSGELEWVSGITSFYRMLSEPDGGVLAMGSITGLGEGSSDVVLMKLSSAGGIEIVNTFGTSAS